MPLFRRTDRSSPIAPARFVLLVDQPGVHPFFYGAESPSYPQSWLRRRVDRWVDGVTLRSGLKIQACERRRSSAETRRLFPAFAVTASSGACRKGSSSRFAVMKSLEEEIEKILLTNAVEKPKPDYSGVYAGLYVFPAMTEGFIRTCIVGDIVKAARNYFSAEAGRGHGRCASSSSSVSQIPRDVPVAPAPRASKSFSVMFIELCPRRTET